MRELSLVVVTWGFSLPWLLLLQSMGSVVHRLQQLWLTSLVILSMWDPPGPGIKSMSLELADRLPSTGIPGKSERFYFNYKILKSYVLEAECSLLFYVPGMAQVE